MDRSSLLSQSTWRRTAHTLLCICVIVSNVLVGLAATPIAQAAPGKQVAEDLAQDAPAVDAVVNSSTAATIYLPIVTNRWVPGEEIPAASPEPLLDLATTCKAPDVTRGTVLGQLDPTLAALFCAQQTPDMPIELNPALEQNLTEDGTKVRVEIVAADLANIAQTVADLEVLGADHLVVYQNLVAVNVPLTQLSALAALGSVQSVRFSNTTSQVNLPNLAETQVQLRLPVPLMGNM